MRVIHLAFGCSSISLSTLYCSMAEGGWAIFQSAFLVAFGRTLYGASARKQKHKQHEIPGRRHALKG